MKQYKNALRSKKLLKDALIELISSGVAFQDITITKLITKADVNRGTFYNHYNNIVDIALEIKDELVEKLYVALEETNKDGRSIENFFEGITKYLKENESTYKKLAPITPKQMFDSIKTQAIQMLDTVYITSSKEEYLKHRFVSNCIAGTYIDYFEGRLDYTLDELKDFSIKTIKMFINMD